MAALFLKLKPMDVNVYGCSSSDSRGYNYFTTDKYSMQTYSLYELIWYQITWISDKVLHSNKKEFSAHFIPHSSFKILKLLTQIE
jgi:hypothetical protein